MATRKIEDALLEITQVMQKEAIDMISESIYNSRISQPTLLTSVTAREKWLNDLVRGMINGADAVETAINLGRIVFENLKITFVRNSVVAQKGVAANLSVYFDDDYQANQLRTIFWGGELAEGEINGKKFPKWVIDAKQGFNKNAIEGAQNEFMELLKERLVTSNPQVKKVIEKYKKAGLDIEGNI
jgi:hypothetical protein